MESDFVMLFTNKLMVLTFVELVVLKRGDIRITFEENLPHSREHKDLFSCQIFPSVQCWGRGL